LAALCLSFWRQFSRGILRESLAEIAAMGQLCGTKGEFTATALAFSIRRAIQQTVILGVRADTAKICLEPILTALIPALLFVLS
jgi:hypothetical protein